MIITWNSFILKCCHTFIWKIIYIVYQSKTENTFADLHQSLNNYNLCKRKIDSRLPKLQIKNTNPHYS